MNRKIIAVILEMIPVVSAPLAYILVVSSADSAFIKGVIAAAFAFAFFGFVFFFIGRKLAGEDRTVRILGILDLVATIFVIGFYALAFTLAGL